MSQSAEAAKHFNIIFIHEIISRLSFGNQRVTSFYTIVVHESEDMQTALNMVTLPPRYCNEWLQKHMAKKKDCY